MLIIQRIFKDKPVLEKENESKEKNYISIYKLVSLSVQGEKVYFKVNCSTCRHNITNFDLKIEFLKDSVENGELIHTYYEKSKITGMTISRGSNGSFRPKTTLKSLKMMIEENYSKYLKIISDGESKFCLFDKPGEPFRKVHDFNE